MQRAVQTRGRMTTTGDTRARPGARPPARPRARPRGRSPRSEQRRTPRSDRETRRDPRTRAQREPDQSQTTSPTRSPNARSLRREGSGLRGLMLPVSGRDIPVTTPAPSQATSATATPGPSPPEPRSCPSSRKRSRTLPGSRPRRPPQAARVEKVVATARARSVWGSCFPARTRSGREPVPSNRDTDEPGRSPLREPVT